MAIDYSQFKKATTTPPATGSIDYSQFKKKAPVLPPAPLIAGPSGDGFLGAIGKGVTDFGVGVGSVIGKTGLGLAELGAKGVGQIAGVTAGEEGKKTWQDIAAGARNISTALYDQPQFVDARKSPMGVAGTVTGTAATYLAPSKAVTGAQGAITKAANSVPAIGNFGRGALGIAGRAVPEAASAGAVTLANTGGDFEEAGKVAALAGGASAALGTLGAGYRALKDTGAVRSALSTTSGIPKGAIDTVAKQGINKAATPEGSLAATRTAVRNLRTKMSGEWDNAVTRLADEFTGTRMGLTDKQLANYAKVIDEFGVDPKLIPQNLRSMSVKESLNLMKGLNELDSLAVKMSPKGAIVRDLRDTLRNQTLQTFGGEKGSVGQLWKTYATKKGVHDSIDNIVKAYTRNKPISDVTAKNRLMAIFDDNKPEFLRAVKELEDELGVNLTKDIASTKFQTVLPKGTLKADGGLPTRSGIIDNIIRAIALPVTSPRMVGGVVGKTGEASPAIQRIFGAGSAP